MADGADLTLDTAKMERDGDRLVRRYLGAGTTAVRGATKQLERNLEQATRAAVPGRLWRAWASKTFPRTGIARRPVGEVFVNGRFRSRGAITFWSRPGEVRAKNGRYLAVPLPAAGKATTPAEWEAQHNTDLEFIPRPGKTALLVAETGRLTKGGSFRRLTVKQLKAGRRGAVIVPMFVLIRVVKFRNSLAIEPIVAAAERDLVAQFAAASRTLS